MIEIEKQKPWKVRYTCPYCRLEMGRSNKKHHMGTERHRLYKQIYDLKEEIGRFRKVKIK